MSIGLSFLKSCIDSSDTASFRRSTEDLFSESEVNHYEFTRDHLTRYGSLPSLDSYASSELPIGRRVQSGEPRFYLDQLRERKAFTAINEIHPQFSRAMQSRNASEAVDILREMVVAGSAVGSGNIYSNVSEGLSSIIEKSREARFTEGLLGITTGFDSFDEVTSGLVAGDLVTIAGRPNVGKSYKLFKMAYEANKDGNKVAIASMEMNEEAIDRRFLSLGSGINPMDIKRGDLGTYDYRRLEEEVTIMEARQAIHKLTANMGTSIANIEELILDTQPEILYVDSSYLIKPKQRVSTNISKHERISLVSGELKALATTYDIPIVQTIQLNRNVSSKNTKKVDLGDTGGSDSYAQDSTIVVAMQEAPAPHGDQYREYDIIKMRDGEKIKYYGEFKFRPMRFSEEPDLDFGISSSEVAPERRVDDLSWMQD